MTAGGFGHLSDYAESSPSRHPGVSRRSQRPERLCSPLNTLALHLEEPFGYEKIGSDGVVRS